MSLEADYLDLLSNLLPVNAHSPAGYTDFVLATSMKKLGEGGQRKKLAGYHFYFLLYFVVLEIRLEVYSFKASILPLC